MEFPLVAAIMQAAINIGRDSRLGAKGALENYVVLMPGWCLHKFN